MRMTQKLSNESFEARFHQKELELNAILEITNAINNNATEESLYMMYKFTLRGNLHIEKLALYVLDDQWNCKVNFGTIESFHRIRLETDALAQTKDIQQVSDLQFEQKAYEEFDIVFPVFHKDKELAYVFLNLHQVNPESGKAENIDIRFVQALSNIILVAIENKKLVRKQLKQEAFKKELEIARSVQSLLFPKKLPYDDQLQIKTTYFPHDQIGGDYYDYIPLNKNKFIVCIADVSGKGIPAALLMSNFQASLRTLVRQTDNLKQIVEELNYQIYENSRGEHFITLFIALFDKSRHTLTYINAGHNPAFLFDYRGNLTNLLDNGTTVLGIFHPLPFLNETTLSNMRNFLLFNYTDGITEVQNPDNEQFGLERLTNFLKSGKQKELNELHGNLISKINHFKKDRKFVDDITLLSCKVNQ